MFSQSGSQAGFGLMVSLSSKNKIVIMDQVNIKSIVLFTGGIFLLLFFHFVPIGFSDGGVTNNSKETKMSVIGENKMNAVKIDLQPMESRADQKNIVDDNDNKIIPDLLALVGIKKTKSNPPVFNLYLNDNAWQNNTILKDNLK